MSSYLSSYYLYIGTVAFSVVFAWLAAAFPLKSRSGPKLNPVFWVSSLLILWFVIGFRFEVGFDYFNYQRIYWNVEDLGFLGYYQAGYWHEPGYIFLLYMVSLVYGNFSGVFVCTSLISLIFFYRSFSFWAGRIQPAWCVFVFATTQYFYYFGIDRLFIAVSIVTFALKFITLGKKRNYYIMVLFAALFHASALFMLLFPFIFGYVAARFNTGVRGGVGVVPKVKIVRYSIFLLMLPVSIYLLSLLIPYLPQRYHDYTMNSQTNLISTTLKIPVGIFLLLTMRRSQLYYPPSTMFVHMYLLAIVIQFFTGFINIGRINWYFWISLCFSFPFAIRSYSRNLLLKMGIVTTVVVYCIGYMFYAYFSSDPDKLQVMFPYRNLFFEL